MDNNNRPAANPNFQKLPGLFEVVAVVSGPGVPGPSIPPVAEPDEVLLALDETFEALKKTHQRIETLQCTVCDMLEENKKLQLKIAAILKQNGI